MQSPESIRNVLLLENSHILSKSITPKCMAPIWVFLKTFATVIVLRNVDPDEGHFNGIGLIIRAFSNRGIEEKIATGIQKHKRVIIGRFILPFSSLSFYLFSEVVSF